MKKTLNLLICFMMFPLLQAQNDEAPDYTKGKNLYVVATAHFDTQWQWTVQSSINEYVPATLRENFKLFEKYPHYNFSFEGAVKYMFAREYYPEDFSRLKDYIKQDRWHVVGSSYDAGDVNIPSPEAIMRNILIAQTYYQKEFGKKSRDIFLPDCFGFGYALPAIMNSCGLKGFSTQKLEWGSSVGIPFDIGGWQGVDGTKVIAMLNPDPYGSQIHGDLSDDPRWLEKINKTGDQSGLYIGYKYFGTGDRGGAPADSSVWWLEKTLTTGTGPIKVHNVAGDFLCRQITPGQLEKLPQYNGELLLTTHGTGCYTSQCAMKRWNRKNELLGDAAERAATAANWLGIDYPEEKLNDSWKRFLWHQFHDDVTGTSIAEVYTFSWNDEIISQNLFSSVLEEAAANVSRALNTQVNGIPLVVYNPLSISREDVVAASVVFPVPPKAVKVFNANGKEIPVQIIKEYDNTLDILFLAKVPSVGFEVYEVIPSASASTIATDVKISNTFIENNRYKVTVDSNGDVSGVLDKQMNKELLQAPIRLELLKDESYIYPAWELIYKDVMAAPEGYVDHVISIEVVEQGPVRATLKVVREKEGSVFTQYIRLAAGKAGDRIDFDTRVNWSTQSTMVKAVFSMAFSNPKATYDLGLGTIERGNNKESLYEVPAQQWADLTASDSSYGMSVMNDCKYGWDKPDDNTLRLTLLHTPGTSGNFMDQATNDLGNHEFIYSVSGHRGDWRNGSQWIAARLNQPLMAFQTSSHDGVLGKSLSMVKVNNDKVFVKALKQAENSDELIIRIQELNGTPQPGVTISFPVSITAAREVNGVEEDMNPVEVKNGKLVVDLKMYQNRTFAVKLEKAPVKLTASSSMPIALPYDLDAVSSDKNRKDGDFDGNGHAIPAELFPSEIHSEGILFKTGSTADKQKNMLLCKGNKINLPSGEYNKIYILAAATEDTKGVFRIDNQPVELSIQAGTGMIGQWDSRIFDGNIFSLTRINGKDLSSTVPLAPGYIKRDPIAWFSTHRHDANTGTNEAYLFCYLFKYAIDVKKGAGNLTLPDNPKIRVAAITAVNDLNSDTRAAHNLYDQLERKTTVAIKTSNSYSYFQKSVTIELTSGSAAADPIFYTLDGSFPTEKSLKYIKPLTKSNNDNQSFCNN